MNGRGVGGSGRCRGLVRCACALLLAAALAPAAESAPAMPAGPGTPTGAGMVSLATLLPDLVDLARLAEFPQPAYRVSESTSRRMPPPRGLSKSVAGNYARIDQREGAAEYVLMEAAGPGVITLISIAKSFAPGYQGILRIYIDDLAVPVIAGPMASLFSGTFPGLPAPLSGSAGNCWNLYLPIAYAARCRVASDDKMLIYHVVYRTYAPGTPITSFAPAQLARQHAALTDLARTLDAPGTPPAVPAGMRTVPFDVELAPGGSAVVAALRGSAAIRRIRLQAPPSADRDDTALRRCLLTMSCDGEATIAAPVLDFFGSAPGINPYQALPMGVARDGWLDSRWVMPYRSSAALTLANHGSAAIRLRGEVITADYPWSAATMLFHAKWRHDLDVPTVPARTWNCLSAAGRGVFVGSAFSIANPLPAWWGEGAERITVDGEASPSLFGTGSDDYYGLGFCSVDLFSHPFHGQTRCDGPANFGRTNLYRFAILDRIPFTASFRFDLEVMHWKDCLVDMDVTDYWYALPGSSDGFAPLGAGDPVLRASAPFQIFHAAGALEAEAMRIIQAPGGTDIREAWGDVGDGRYLRWSPSRPGDVLVLGFEVAAAGDYRIIGQFLRGAGFATIQLAFNGVRGGGPIALARETFYADPTGEIDLGVYHLAAGANRLAVSCLAEGPAAGKPAPVGIDYIIPQPIRESAPAPDARGALPAAAGRRSGADALTPAGDR
jgi:hypothetical protein